MKEYFLNVEYKSVNGYVYKIVLTNKGHRVVNVTRQHVVFVGTFESCVDIMGALCK